MSEPMYMSNADREPVQNPVLQAVLNVWSQAGGRHYISITGRSMLPLIRDGDYVLVAHRNTGVKRGDVVVFRYDGKLVAHRVLRIYKGETGYTFITKGDNVLQFDPPLSANEIVGKVLVIKRGQRQMSLDTAIWRILGWHIAISTLAWTGVYTWGRYFIQRLFRIHSIRPASFLHRCAQFFFLFIRKSVFVFISRWKE